MVHQPYPWDLLPRVAEHIEHGRAEPAQADLHILWQRVLVDMHGDIALLKLRCAQIMSTCMRGALRGGAPSERLYAEHVAALHLVQGMPTRIKIRNHLRSYTADLVAQVHPMKKVRLERVMLSLVTQMRQSLDQPHSLAHFARDLELSVGHLSRSFARIVGRTFGEERRRLRNEALCAMLTQTELSLSAMAQRVGLSSVSQLIADFRQEYAMTPRQYRDLHG
jgi:AraC-like DNA-binding protein